MDDNDEEDSKGLRIGTGIEVDTGIETIFNLEIGIVTLINNKQLILKRRIVHCRGNYGWV